MTKESLQMTRPTMDPSDSGLQVKKTRVHEGPNRDSDLQWANRESDPQRTRGLQKDLWNKQSYFIANMQLKLYLAECHL